MCAPLYIQTSTWALDCSTLEELVQGTSVGTFWGPKDNLDKSRPPPRNFYDPYRSHLTLRFSWVHCTITQARTKSEFRETLSETPPVARTCIYGILDRRAPKVIKSTSMEYSRSNPVDLHVNPTNLGCQPDRKAERATSSPSAPMLEYD